MNVYPIPHMAWAASTAANSGIAPSSANPEPMSKQPVMTDRRRPKVSANTPVGTSKTKTATSSAVPSNTSRNGSRPPPRSCKRKPRWPQQNSA